MTPAHLDKLAPAAHLAAALYRAAVVATAGIAPGHHRSDQPGSQQTPLTSLRCCTFLSWSGTALPSPPYSARLQVTTHPSALAPAARSGADLLQHSWGNAECGGDSSARHCCRLPIQHRQVASKDTAWISQVHFKAERRICPTCRVGTALSCKHARLTVPSASVYLRRRFSSLPSP